MNLTYFQNKVLKIISTKDNIFSIFLILIIFLLDRLSKFKALEELSENVFYVNDFVNFDLVWNTGIGFGLFNSDSNLIYSSTSAIIALVIIYLFYIGLKSENADKFIFSIIIGGALGNFCDRLVYKAVPDFIDFHFENFHWFTFNVADIFITLGVFSFLLKGLFEKK